MPQLLPAEVRNCFPMFYQDPTFITKVPEAYRTTTVIDSFDNKKRPKSPPLNINFSDCRHLSDISSKKKSSINPSYDDLYKEVSFTSRRQR